MKTSHVLYVEDDPVNAMLMQGILELRPGYVLQVARSGAEARRLATQGTVDLLLCDLHLPDIGGGELLSQLRAGGLPASVPALLVTAESDDVAAQLARHHGYDGHWTKPLDVAATLRSLERWLA
jgi:CheY-like chemotaxis protein